MKEEYWEDSGIRLVADCAWSYPLPHLHFLTSKNIMNVLQQISTNGMIAFGMTYVILLGGIDLSVGSVVALSGVMSMA